MLVRVLGDLEVVVDGRVVDLGGPKPRAVLGQLVAAEGRPVPVERLIDQVWGEQPPARVEASLQSYVARLRRVLEPDRGTGRPGELIRTHAGGYSLDVAASAVDARRFAELVRASRDAAPDDAVALLEEALGLWRGDPYAGLAGPALEAEATRLLELRMAALTRWWELRLARGEHAEAVAELDQLTRLHPLREQLWALLALALYRDSRQADALAALRRIRSALAEELGVDPGPELRALEEAVLRQDPALDLQPVPAPVQPGPAPVQPVPVDPTAGPTPSPTPSPMTPDTTGTPLHGREQWLAEVERVLDEAGAGRGRTVVVSGEPGIGKTRFTEAAVERAAGRGFRTGRGTWEPEACPALWGWTRALTQALGSPHLLAAAAEDSADAASAVFRQADAVLTGLASGAPTLLVLDDVHWADAASLRLLRRLAAELASVPVVLVVALRSAPAEVGAPLADVLAALARLDPLRVELGGLPVDAVRAWVAEHAGVDVDDAVAGELAARTDGNPFYVTELVRLLVAEGALSDVAAPAWRAVPHGVRDVVRQRLASLPPHVVGVLTAAAVAGRSFDLAVVAEVVADPVAVEEAVESALVLGLLGEEGPGRYRFAHALVRDAVRESLSGPARSRTHAAVAAALETVQGGRVREHAAELAEHYRLAGPAFARSAWHFALRAGEAASAASAHDEALRLLTDAAELQEGDPTVEPVERERALRGRVRALARVARPLEAWEPAAAATRSALARGDGPAAAEALLSVTERVVWGWRTHPTWDDDAIALWREVLARQPREAVLVRAKIIAAIAVEMLYRPGSADEATALADQAVTMVRSSGRRGHAELQVLRLAQMALLRPDLLDRRAPLSDDIVALALEVGEPSDVAAALTARAQGLGEQGRLQETRSDVVRAHELAVRHHLSQNLVVSGWCLAMLKQLAGDLASAEGDIGAIEQFQATLAMSGTGIEVSQLAHLRDVQGRLAELEPQLRQGAPYHPAIRELHALALVRAGRHDELRLLLGSYDEQPAFSFDYMWLPYTAVRAEIWCALGDVAAAGRLYDDLLPYQDRLAYSVPVSFRGSTHHVLGELARVAGDPAAAARHLEAALQVHRDLALDHWVGRTEDALARLAGAPSVG